MKMKKLLALLLALVMVLGMVPTSVAATVTQKTIANEGITVNYTSKGTASFTKIGSWDGVVDGEPMYLLTLPSDAEISGIDVVNPENYTVLYEVAGKNDWTSKFDNTVQYPTQAEIAQEVGLVSDNEFVTGADEHADGYAYNLFYVSSATIANIPATDVSGYMVVVFKANEYDDYMASPGIIVQYASTSSGTTTYLDTTDLAEAIRLNNIYYPVENASQYTTASWTAYRAVMDPAEAFLAGATSLLDTADNRATRDAHTAAVEAIVTDQVLDFKLSTLGVSANSRLNDAKMACEALKTLRNNLFNPNKHTATNYENWSDFSTACDTAAEFLATHDGTTLTLESGVNEALSYVTAYQTFWTACYALRGTSETISVTLDVSDTFARINGLDHLVGGSYALTLSKGATLEDAAQAAEIDLNALSSWSTYASVKLGVYINGIYTQYAIGQESFPTAKRDGITLNDGDRVLLARMDAPMAQSSAGGSSGAAGLGEVGRDFRYAYFQNGNKEITSYTATSGTEFTLTAAAYNPLPTHYSGRTTTLAGAEIYRSAAYKTEAEARAAAADVATGVVTGADGSFTLALYSAEGSGEGWYLLNILSGYDDPGLTNAAHVLVHVTDPDDLSSLREQLKDALTALETRYEDGFYTEAQLAEVKRLAGEGRTALDAARTSGNLNAAYETAREGIEAIQEGNIAAFEVNRANIATCLAWLPTKADLNAGKIYQADMILLEALFGDDGIFSVKMSDYQKRQMNQGDLSLLQALQTVYAEVKAGTRTLEALPENEVKVLFLDAATGETIDEAFFHRITFNLEKLADALRWDGELLRVKYSGSESTVYRASGTPWPGSHGIVSDRLYRCVISSVIKAPGYVLDHIEAPLDEHHYVTDGTWEGETWYSTSASGVEGALCNLSAAFNTPRSDIEIRIYLKAESPVDAVRATALQTLETAYKSYKRNNYSEENWSVLYQAYQDGVAAINAATTEAEIDSALTAATSAMAAVPQKTENPEAIPGWGVGDPFDAGAKVGTVTITAENNTFPGGAFPGNGQTGTIFTETNYAIGENDNMMTVILRALHDNEFTWAGDGGSASDAYDIGYLELIFKGGQEMGEFSGDPGSGWMGTLNDFMVNEGLNQFTVAGGMLGDGDVIALRYTQNLGEDLGGTWGNSDTTLETLTVSTGTLIPGFASGEAGNTYDYALMISGSSANVTVTPHASNINYMVKTFLNEKVTTDAVGNSYYRRREAIPVRPGDVIWVGCGERSWPSMNKQGAEATAYTGTWYALHVINADSGADYVNELIGKLPEVKYGNYEDVAAQIADIEAVTAALNASEQAKVNTSTLEAARGRAESFKAVDEVKALLAALPKSSNLSDNEVIAARRQIEAADAAYKALTDEQKGYITVRDVSNYNALVERLAELTPDTTAEVIEGSTGTPETVAEAEDAEITVAPEVTDGEASAEVSAETVADALKDSEDADALTVKVETEDADSVELALPADAVKAAAEAEVGLNVETEVGTVKLDADTLGELAESGKDVAVTVSANEDGTTTIDVTADGESVDAKVKVELPAAEDNQVLVIVNEDGTEEIVKKSLVEDGKAYAEIPTGATVKVVDNDKEFGDVKGDEWYAEAVEFVASHELFQGTNNGFEPGLTMNRAMLATVLYRLEDAAATGESSFDDVDPESWYADAAAWAEETGIINGTDKGFEPNAPVTREQIATMLYRYANLIGLDTAVRGELDGFTDGGDTASWAKDAMEWAVSVGLFRGDDTGALNPKGDATRAEVATLFERMIKLIVK